MKYYIKDNRKVYDCFSQPGLDRSKLLKVFTDVNRYLSEKRNRLSLKNKWNVLTITANSKGNITSYFDYDDINDKSIEYFKKWEKKYL